MPEPVVIIGPSARPAGPTSASPESAAEADSAGTGVQEQESAQSDDRKRSPLLPALARVAGGLSSLVVRALWALSRGMLSIASRNPRHSLAAGASILILGTILYTELRPGHGARSGQGVQSGQRTRQPVTVQIPGDRARAVADSSPSTGSAKSTDASKDGSKTDGSHDAPAPEPGKANPGGTATVRSDANSSKDKSSSAPAPEITALEDAPPPLPGNTETPAPAQEHQPTPDKVASTSELAESPKAEPMVTPLSTPDQAAATLLTQSPPAPTSTTGTGDTGSTDPVKTAAAPTAASAADLSPSPIQSAEHASLPAPSGDPLQLAGALERVGDQKESNPPTSAPHPVQPEPANTASRSPGVAGQVDPKPKDETHAQTTVAHDSPVESKSVPAHDSKSSTAQAESTKMEPAKSEGIQSLNQEVEKAASGIAGAANTPGVGAIVPLPIVPTPPQSEPTSPAKPVVESSAPSPAAAGPGPQSIATEPPAAPPNPTSPGAASDSRFETPSIATPTPAAEALPPDPTVTQTTDSRGPEQRGPQNKIEGTKPEARSRDSDSTSRDPKPRSSTLAELSSAGWVSVPNSGKVLIDADEDANSSRGDADNGKSVDAFAGRDFRSHAAKDVSFEQESSRNQAAENTGKGAQSSSSSVAAAAEPSSRSAAERVESVPHVVERGENFWIISRLYYSSARYYRALWKANANKHPKITDLSVNDVIMIPPIEDLDPAFIDPPRTQAPAAPAGATRTSSVRPSSVGKSPVSLSSIDSAQPVAATRTNRGSADGVPVRQSSRTDPELDPPAPEAVARRDRGTNHDRHSSDVALSDDNDNNEPETRTAARPRADGAAPLRRPVYKVRQYDSLRSIARDMLGDSHRSGEILDLNRDLIDDPTHLIVGQVLELPDDARTSLRRSASR
jgi:nucleoid-associated protein YgaU